MTASFSHARPIFRYGALAACLLAVEVLAQAPPTHLRHSTNWQPPGAIGQDQARRGGPLPGYYQPVEVSVPGKARIALAINQQFQKPENSSVMAGMLIGPVYRFHVVGVDGQPGSEVFPTVEIVNRLYPPRGLERHFPIPVQISQQELEQALKGRLVTRVIYLEDPQTALELPEDPSGQRYFEVRPDEDPLQVADRLGRPMAILRMGSRIPVIDPGTRMLAEKTPPLLMMRKPKPLPDHRSGLEEPLLSPGRRFPRTRVWGQQ